MANANVSVSINGKSFDASNLKSGRSTSANEDESLTRAEYDELKDLFDALEDFVVE